MDPRIERLLDDLGTPTELRPSLREALDAAAASDVASVDAGLAAGCD